MIQVECIGSTHNNLLWYESDDCVTRQCTSDTEPDSRMYAGFRYAGFRYALGMTAHT